MNFLQTISIFAFELSLLLLLIYLFYGLYRGWKIDRDYARERDKERKLQKARERDSYLYRLIKNQQGRVTLLQYALESGLSAEEARNYLETRATDFGAHVEVNDQGETVYQFIVGGS